MPGIWSVICVSVTFLFVSESLATHEVFKTCILQCYHHLYHASTELSWAVNVSAICMPSSYWLIELYVFRWSWCIRYHCQGTLFLETLQETFQVRSTKMTDIPVSEHFKVLSQEAARALASKFFQLAFFTCCLCRTEWEKNVNKKYFTIASTVIQYKLCLFIWLNSLNWDTYSYSLNTARMWENCEKVPLLTAW